MGSTKVQPPSNSSESSYGRLDSWKEIAAYLRRDERTVRRWEAEGLPVHRKVHKKQASVYAYKTELDAWWHHGQQRLEQAGRSHARKRLITLVLIAAGLVIVGVLGIAVSNVGGLRERLRGNATMPPAIRSIAVLPLENLSRDPQQEYFADGMTEELTTELAQIGALKVISHTSVVQYKGSLKSMPQIAKELGVDGVVEGAVEESGDRVEITVQLIHAPSDRHLWAKSYERRLRDVLDLQREVTHSITDELKAELTLPEQMRLSSSRSIDSEAYQDYLRGRYLLSTYDSNAEKAISYFQLAIRKDPNCASAYAGMAEAYIVMGQPWNSALPPNEVLPKAKAAATKAIAIDDSLSEAHSALAHVIELYDWNWTGAENQYRKALQLNPNDVTAHFWYGEYLQAMGRSAEGIAQIRAAIALDPLNPAHVAELGSQFLMARQYDGATLAFQKTFQIEPDNVWAHAGLGWVFEQKKMYREAIAEFEKALILTNRRDDTSLASLGKVLAESGRKQESRKILLELAERSKHRYVSPYLLGYVQVGLGNRDQALALLEQGLSDRDQWLPFLNVDPEWDGLRSDPHFKDLLRRIGLTPMQR